MDVDHAPPARVEPVEPDEPVPYVAPDYSAAKTGLTCLPQRAALLKSMLNFLKKAIQVLIPIYPPVCEANLTERKNPHTPVYGVKEFVCLFARLSVANFDPNYLRNG